ncbi:MAG: AAA family ATPase, partial [Lachnospiraceae bacterium]|nr:AAA family ATPase [Lachnospiraceae bacterium]
MGWACEATANMLKAEPVAHCLTTSAKDVLYQAHAEEGRWKMGKKVAIGVQDFEKIRQRGSFYVDKTDFIKKWWESNADVTLITRPRRFGKTLNMSMLNCFFSNKYAGRGDLFEGLNVWEDEGFRELQGSYPVIFVTFAGIKAANFRSAVYGVKYQIAEIFNSYNYLASNEELSENERQAFNSMTQDMSDDAAQYALRFLSQMLSKVNHGKKVLIFLDEYDTPLQEAWNYGYWEELVQFTRLLFNNTFKTNPYMERAVMTGITRVSRESLFSDLNNLDVCTLSTEKYETCFGFTEDEVFAAMDEEGMGSEMKEEVKRWYDGFIIGRVKDIYNPWSITNFLDAKKFRAYWANTSSNALAGKLVREGDAKLKEEFETLL